MKNSKSEKQTETTEKKPFDKKKWRERKYSHKFKVQQFEDRRKKKVLRKYYQELKHIQGDGVKTEPAPSVDPAAADQQLPKEIPKVKLNASQRARLELERIQAQKEERKADIEKNKAEKDQKLQEYKAKKAEKFKRLSKKTRKGQPVMKDRLEMLLEKIQKQCS